MENILQNKQYIKSTIYCRPGHYSFLESMRLQEVLCDVTIEVGHSKFKAHKIILAATIRYFQNMFRSFQERSKEIISIKNISATNMKAFITFAYTGQITLTEDNVISLLKDADYLDLTDIREECLKFLQSCIHARNVCEVYLVGEVLDCAILLENSLRFMREYFRDVSLTDDYLDLDFQFLKDLLSSYDLQSLSQAALFQAIGRWVISDVDERKHLSSELLELVGFPDLSIDYSVKDGLIVTGYGHSNLMTEVMSTKKFKKDGLRIEKKYIFVIQHTNANIIETYNPVLDIWELSTVKRHFTVGSSTTVHQGRLYAFGGYINQYITVSAQVYEPENKCWIEMAPMNFKRTSCGAAALDGFLYVCGGQTDDNKYSDVLERYCFESNEWKTMSPMSCCRQSLAVIAFQGYIYAIGGYQGLTVFSSVERYDPQTNQWTTLDTSMKEKRNACGTAVLNGKFYVCGGRTEMSWNTVSSVEVYDPETNKWEYVASMNTARKGFLVVEYIEKLWAIGGDNERDDFSTVEVYDPNTDSWSYAKSMKEIKGEVTGGVVSIC